MKKKFSFILLITVLLASVLNFSYAEGAGQMEIEPLANPVFSKYSASINSSMTATMTATTSILTTISVSSCTLEKKVNGSWTNAGSLSTPASVSGIISYAKTMSYSGSCTKGVTYRIKVTFSAGGESVTCNSNELTY